MKIDKISAEKFESQVELENILNKYSNKLIGFINSIVQDVNASEDIMMDVFVELLIRKPEFENEQAFKSYLFKCSKNKALNFVKKNKRLCELSEDNLKDTYEIEDKICNNNTKKILLGALKKLTNNYRTVLYLSYFEDMSDDEIQSVMGINDKKVRNLKHRAKKKLNKILKEQNFEFKG